ncbi:putative G3BP-like protein [Glycine max]|nr:putative G3BP-like protein [Glycine max]
MATHFPFPLSAAQVGTYFVGQYYHVLETNPELVYQFYSDASTMVRIDGNARDTATAMLQIHALVMSLSFIGIEIKTAQSLESWSGGVLVMVSGSVQLKGYNVRRQFMQTFFLAPQEKGFFVLNDVFHFVEEEPVHHHQPVKENGAVNNYGFSHQQMLRVHDSEHIQEDVVAEESHGSFQPTVDAVQEHVPSAEESPEEPQKHTYASILRVAKGQATPSVASQPSQKNLTSLDWDHAPLTNSQQTTSFERSETVVVEEAPTTEDEGYCVYSLRLINSI